MEEVFILPSQMIVISSAPIRCRQLPNEARLFAQVDKSWKDIMRRTIDKPNALRASTAAGKRAGLIIAGRTKGFI